MPRKRDESDFKKALRFCKDLSASDQKALVDALSVLNEKPSPEPPKEQKAGKKAVEPKTGGADAKT